MGNASDRPGQGKEHRIIMMELAGKKIVITGATGFIGRNVARMLLKAGAQVYALVRPESRQKAFLPDQAGHPETGFHVIEGNMEEAEQALLDQEGGLDGFADAFLHFAWGGVNRQEIDSPKVQQRNVEASLGCLRAARRLGCQVFMDAGSRVEYGITEDGTMEESMECHPVNAYGKAKLAFYRQEEALCREWGMTCCHLRFFSVYGTGDHPWSIISTLVRELPQDKTVSLSACMHRWNFMHIQDAARAVLELYRHSDSFAGTTHIVNVASEDTRRLRDFVEEIHALCGGRGKLEYGTFVQAKEGALSICPTVNVLRELTEGTWQEQVTFADGIRSMLQAEHGIK